MDQSRLMRFFAFSDSNTHPRVRISVLGHVVVSQTCMVQVPYAAVTGKYFRALIIRTVIKTIMRTVIRIIIRTVIKTIIRTIIRNIMGTM